VHLLAKLTSAVLIAVLLAGCSLPKIKFPRLYRVTIQQGNVITQEMVDKLKPGMTRSQVAFIMGEPILRNTFDENRWDYVYTVYLPGYFDQEVRMSLFFQDEVLAYFTGDLAPSIATDDDPVDETSAPIEEASS
jgi:outer membrane protein assembly factor BamE